MIHRCVVLVKDLCQAIKQYRSLKALRLEGNTINEEAASEIGKALESHPEIEVNSLNSRLAKSFCLLLTLPAFDMERFIHNTIEDRSSTIAGKRPSAA